MSSDTPIAQRILSMIQVEAWSSGAHLPAQLLANRFGVSRTPVNQALTWLADRDLVERRRNKGFFVKPAAHDRSLTFCPQTMPGQSKVELAYLRIAEECFSGQLPDVVTESQLRELYCLSQAQVKSVLRRIEHEGWISKNAGYGWTFAPMLNSPEALMQTYRLRVVVEPAALLEPGYYLSPEIISRCRDAEVHLLEGGIETDSPDQIYQRGVDFHEALVEASGNPFFIDTIKRVNKVRRLISYRSMQDRDRYAEQCRQHLRILGLLEKGQQIEASEALRRHLHRTLTNHQKIQKLLRPKG